MSLINLAQSPDKQRGAARPTQKRQEKSSAKDFQNKKKNEQQEAKKQINNKWKASKRKKIKREETETEK